MLDKRNVFHMSPKQKKQRNDNVGPGGVAYRMMISPDNLIQNSALTCIHVAQSLEIQDSFIARRFNINLKHLFQRFVSAQRLMAFIFVEMSLTTEAFDESRFRTANVRRNIQKLTILV
uniref:Uncharacterized protein n=1 Tax=Romanomermis culicivorax TaxID=13658 RepID=A0A915K4N7_ROMCU